MALFTFCRAFFHFDVAILTGLAVSSFLTETFNLSAFGFRMALRALFKGFCMGFVLEGDSFFQLHYISCKC